MWCVSVIKKPPEIRRVLVGAENGIRTRDPNLGKVMLYQLSYFREEGVGVGVSVSVDWRKRDAKV